MARELSRTGDSIGDTPRECLDTATWKEPGPGLRRGRPWAGSHLVGRTHLAGQDAHLADGPSRSLSPARPAAGPRAALRLGSGTRQWGGAGLGGRPCDPDPGDAGPLSLRSPGPPRPGPVPPRPPAQRSQGRRKQSWSPRRRVLPRPPRARPTRSRTHGSSGSQPGRGLRVGDAGAWGRGARGKGTRGRGAHSPRFSSGAALAPGSASSAHSAGTAAQHGRIARCRRAPGGGCRRAGDSGTPRDASPRTASARRPGGAGRGGAGGGGGPGDGGGSGGSGPRAARVARPGPAWVVRPRPRPRAPSRPLFCAPSRPAPARHGLSPGSWPRFGPRLRRLRGQRGPRPARKVPQEPSRSSGVGEPTPRTEGPRRAFAD